MNARRLLGYVWASPVTLLGLAPTALALATGGRARRVRGVLEVHGGALTRLLSLRRGFQIEAITLGHVVLGVTGQALELTREHERIHVRQTERWGPAFPIAYLAVSAWLWARGRDPYRDNPFEREAYALEPSDATR